MGLPGSSPAALDLAQPEHLEPPPGDELRYLVRDECALLLDGYLRRLARQEALGRDVHHLFFRSRGGGNARTNRITVCAWHHLAGDPL